MGIVFRSRVFDVEVVSAKTRDGGEMERAIVRHGPAVVLIPMPDPAHVIMIRQYRIALDRWIWELPAGNVEPNEAPEAAAARESDEEIALVPGRIERVGAFYPVPGYCDELMVFFKLSELRPRAPDSPTRPDADEQIDVHQLLIADARALVARGEVIDLKTAYGLTLI